jgi:hypothetical protein
LGIPGSEEVGKAGSKQVTKNFVSLKEVPFRVVLLPVLITVLAKVALYFLFISGDPNHIFVNRVFIDNPDRGEFLTPIDNYIGHGNYSLVPDGKPYAGRLPGFVFPYILFRALLNENLANWLLGAFIFGISVFASLQLSKLLYATTGKRAVVFFGLISAEILSYYWHWDWVLHPNSLGASCILLGIVFFYEHLISGKTKYLLLCGFFLSWLFFLRGFTLIFIPVAALVLVLHVYSKTRSVGKCMVKAGVLLLPLGIFEGMWIARNYRSLGEFVPLQTSFVPGSAIGNSEYGFHSMTKPSLMSLRSFIDCWGGDNFWYFSNSDMSWFTSRETEVPAGNRFSPSVFGKGLTPDSIDQLRSDVLFSLVPALTASQHDSIESLVISKSKRYRSRFVSEKPLYFALVSPVKRLGNLFLKNPVQDWPGPTPRLHHLKMVFKLISAAIYFGNLLVFFLILFFRFRQIKSDSLLMLLALLALGLMLVFAYLLNVAHYSYFIFGYIPLVVFNAIAGFPMIEWRAVLRRRETMPTLAG